MPRQLLRRASLVHACLSGLSPGSRRTIRFGLTTACQFLGGTDAERFARHRVRLDQLCALRADLAGRLVANTANKILAAATGELADVRRGPLRLR